MIIKDNHYPLSKVNFYYPNILKWHQEILLFLGPKWQSIHPRITIIHNYSSLSTDFQLSRIMRTLYLSIVIPFYHQLHSQFSPFVDSLFISGVTSWMYHPGHNISDSAFIHLLHVLMTYFSFFLFSFWVKIFWLHYSQCNIILGWPVAQKRPIKKI